MARHTSVFAALLAIAHFAGALRESENDGVEMIAADFEEADVQRHRPYERLCCLEAVEPEGGLDNGDADPKVSSIHMDMTKEHKKCVLITIPWACQGAATAEQCVSACKESFKTNPAWSEKVSSQAQGVLEATEKSSAEEQQAAKTKHEKDDKHCKDTEEADILAAQKKKESDVKQHFDGLSTAVLAHEDDDKTWRASMSTLEGEMQALISAYEKQVESIVEAAELCRANAKAAFDEVVTRTEAAKEKASQNAATWKKKFEDLTSQKEAERSSSKVELGSPGACMVNGKLENCCCSFREPAKEDGSHAEGQAMKVKAGQFANWDKCYGAQPYSKASTGLFSKCHSYGKCNPCWKLLCPKGGMCP